ncbi:fungal-specific transcription factor domain-containing protein [Lasiosphaeria hispida]|uniref:Fungal-specific transcription factor domain-containing protein n=1 Tax=Lasiosphaeria hispida TaxID=260671 RepID=A0AAJ0H8A0_9PEZI|nr:fungal-specific transcription factor domain-containing protein [Lasiosphaeria hispida]
MDIALNFFPTASTMLPGSANQSASQVRNSSGSTSDGDGQAETSSHAKRLACNPCRERKVRCDRRQPQCGRCAKMEASCHYSSPSKHAMSKSDLSRMLIALHGRLENAEAQLAMGNAQVSMHQFAGPWPDSAFMTSASGPVLLPSPQSTPSNHVTPIMGIPRATDWSGRLPNETSDVQFGGLDMPTPTDFNTIMNSAGGVGIDPMLEELSNSLYSDDDIGDMTSRLSLALFPKLHAAYFEAFHPAFPIINRTRFQKELDRGGAQSIQVQALSYAMATLGALATREHSYAFETCYNHARNLLDRCERQDNGSVLTNINTLQACALLCLYELKKPNFTRAWMTLGRAIRLAKIMCLDKTDADDPAETSHRKLFLLPPPALDPADMEERRRTFWLLYVLDGCAVMRSNTPSAFENQHPIVPLPSPGDLDDFSPTPTAAAETPLLHQTLAPTPTPPLSPLAATVLAIALHHLATRGPGNTTFWTTYHATTPLLAHLRPAILSSPPGPLALALRIHLSAVELTLHQAAIAHLPPPCPLACEASARAVHAAARDILDAARDAQRLGGPEAEVWGQLGVLAGWGLAQGVRGFLGLVERDKSEAAGYVKAVRVLCGVLGELVDVEGVMPGFLDGVEGRVREVERPMKRRYTSSSLG